ncbi:MAG: methylated-DNA--[protein]-cysteine S-methyltransferase [Hyphomicrobiales bacterium]
MITVLTDRIETPLGPMLLLARDGMLIGLEFDDQPERIARDLRLRYGASERFPAVNPHGYSDRIRAYFAGHLAAIDDIPADGGGTEFQRRVWVELRRIPSGKTSSYGALAKRLGNANATRAVGLACGRNPIAVVVPCHRVIGADGSLTGYGGGIGRKKWLLCHEGIPVAMDRVSAQGDLFAPPPGQL